MGTFLKGIKMKPPLGLWHPSGYVCRRRRALYGLKQAPWAWFIRFSDAFCSIWYIQSASDSTLFYHFTSFWLCPAPICWQYDHYWQWSSWYLEVEAISSYPIWDERPRHPSLLFRHWNHLFSKGIAAYSTEIYSRHPSKGCPHRHKLVETSMEVNAKMGITGGTLVKNSTCNHQVVGSLVYLTITRLDISFAVHVVNQFMAAPTTFHWAAVLWILR